MKAAFYKGKKRIFNRVTASWTNGPYSHMEIAMADGLSVSSSFMDKGFRTKLIEYNPENWDFVQLHNVDMGQFDTVMLALEGKKFDILGLAGFVLAPFGEDSDRVFCSETCMMLLGYQQTWRFNPNTAFVVLEKIDREIAARK